MRVIVIGGLGNFGARICRDLARDPGIALVATGRNPESTRINAGIEKASLDLREQRR